MAEAGAEMAVGVAPGGEEAASVDIMAAGEPRLFLFDPEHADACRDIAINGNLASARAVAGRATSGTQSCEARAIVGDRVRFALDLFAAANPPAVVVGVSTYADFILLSGTAAEHGYRVLEESAQGSLVSWKIARLRRSTSSG
jgi:hypothetical protein